MNKCVQGLLATFILSASSAVIAKTTPKFELKNKSKNIIIAYIGQRDPVRLGANENLPLTDVDANNVEKIIIDYCSINEYGKETIDSRLSVSIDSGSYETMYLKFGVKKKQGYLEPQKGILNKTLGGYSLSNNIQKKYMHVRQEKIRGGMKKSTASSSALMPYNR